MVLIGIHSDPEKDKMLEVAKETGMTWPLLLDPESKIMEAYGARGYPSYYLVDRKGVLRHEDVNPDDLDGLIEKLVQEE